MADFALGLTKTAVEGTLSRVKSAIEEEAKLKVTVQHDLVFITGEFQMMQSFLEVASKDKERANNQVVKTWVRQLRDLAFDVEDCVELVVHLDNNTSSWTWTWRLVPSCMAPPRHLDAAVAEINLLKARVEEVSQRNARYNLITDSGSSKQHVSSPPLPAAAAFDILRDIWDAEGMICSMDDLKNFITAGGDDGRQVISVWESTGGAASVLKKLYNDPKVCDMFTGRCAWVKLVHPFNPDEFLQSMLTQLCSSSQDPTNHGSFVKKAQDLEQLLSEHRYLVILEEVSTIVEWNFISSFLPNNNQSRIVVSTNQISIASSPNIYEPIQVLKLSGGQPLFVFLSKDFADRIAPRASRSQLDEAREFHKKIVRIWTDDEYSRLQMLFLKNKDGVKSVWGITGLGKSSLVRSVYYETLIDNHENRTYHIGSFKKYSWVDVPNPFNLVEFARRLFLDFHSYCKQTKQTVAIGMVEGLDPIQGCHKLLDEGNCLIVIDDLRSTEDWDTIKAALPQLGSNGSYVFVITSQATVARHCVNNIKGLYQDVYDSKMLNIKGLYQDDAFILLKKVIWGGEYSELTPEEEKISKHTVAKCGGLATVIFAIGKYCSTPKLPMDHRRATKYWLEVLNNDFINILGTHPDLQHLFSWIRSYFDACSDSVKPCIFYLSVFPSGSNIRRSRLIRRWIAEGYSRNSPGSTAEENAANLFSELVNLSIIQQTQRTLVGYVNLNFTNCQVNTFFHEYIISQPMEDNLVFALEGSCSPNTQRSGRHLTIRSSWDRDTNVFKSIDFSRLRSLTVLGEWKPFFVSNKIRMTVLRVLDLEGSVGVTYHDLEEIGKVLPRLKFLSLRGCRQIKQLPDSLGGLKLLQTLDVRHTSIVMLPPAIFRIQKLQYIRAGTCAMHVDDHIFTTVPLPYGNQTSAQTQDRDGSSMQQEVDRPPVQAVQKNEKTWPSSWLGLFSKKSKLHAGAQNEGVEVPAAARIGKLTALHTLGVINVNGAGGKAILKNKELDELTQLRKLGVSGINSGNIGDFISAISGYHHLESLSVRLDEDIFLDGISLPMPIVETLESLKLHGNMKKLPVSWVKRLGNLRKLKLELTVSGQEDIDLLAVSSDIGIKFQLTRLLVKLRSQGGGKLFFGWPADAQQDTTPYMSLIVLEIDCISSSSDVITFGSSMMSQVEVLKVRCSKEASLTFSGLEYLRHLKEVWLIGSFDDCDTLKQEMQQQLVKLRNKPVLKLVRPRSS